MFILLLFLEMLYVPEVMLFALTTLACLMSRLSNVGLLPSWFGCFVLGRSRLIFQTVKLFEFSLIELTLFSRLIGFYGGFNSREFVIFCYFFQVGSPSLMTSFVICLCDCHNRLQCFSQIDRELDRQTDRQIDRQIARQIGRQVDRQIDIEIAKWVRDVLEILQFVLLDYFLTRTPTNTFFQFPKYVKQL